MGKHTKLPKHKKMESGEKKVATTLKKHGHITIVQRIYKTVILPLLITKMPLWAENVGLVTWTGYGAKMAMMWQPSLHLKISVQAPKFAPQNI